ncbi:MAG: ABC transporter permease [Ignavibacteriales bacterium]|nr:ABC transporter permease [Ignavibacteriales bacterium]
MFKLLVEKELKNIIQSPKFVATFITCSVLIILSFAIGINEYNNSVKQFNTAKELSKQEMTQSRSWFGLASKGFRQPDPMQIFSAGVNNDIGRYSIVHSTKDVKLQNSYYSDDPVFAVFRYVDFTFIVTVIFSLFAILFTYNSINGEKEDGTMRLIFSNSIPRTTFITAKFVGSWLGLVVPLLIPILIGLLMLLLFKIPLSAFHWISISILIFMAILYLTFFSAFGVFISSLTKYSSVSFLILLVAWILFVFIIPRAGVMTASQFIKVPSIAEAESMKDAYSKNKWDQHFQQLSTLWANRNSEMKGMSESEKQAYQDDNSYAWLEQEDKLRTEMQKQISDYSLKLGEDLRNKQSALEKMALTISRFSPASSFQLASMNLSSTGIDLKARYEKEIQDYKKNFVDYTAKKQKESGNQAGMFRISVDSKSGVKISTGRNESTLDIKDVPIYTPSNFTLAEVISPTIIDIGLLILYSILSYGAAFFVFRKYDLR